MIKKQLYVDGRFFKKHPDGVARYITEIISRIDKENYEIIYCSNKPIHLPNKLISKDKKYKIIELNTFRYLPGTLFILFILPFYLKNKKGIFLGLAHAVPLFGMSTILVIHDLVAFEFPDTMTWSGKFLNKLSIILSIRFTNKLISVSKFTEERIKMIFKSLQKNIYIIRNSVDRNVFYPITNKNKENFEIFSKLKIVDNYILSVGTLEPRKNLFSLIEAYKKLLDDKLYSGKLVLVGASGWKNHNIVKFINDYNLEKNIIIPGYLSDYEINILMNYCDVFVFPSIYEGFGIPPLEAYCTNTKVLCTIYSELKNLNLKNLFLFDPLKDSLEVEILKVLNSDIQIGCNYKETWNNSAEELLKIIRTLEKKC